jgi:hypothetical protein
MIVVRKAVALSALLFIITSLRITRVGYFAAPAQRAIWQ